MSASFHGRLLHVVCALIPLHIALSQGNESTSDSAGTTLTPTSSVSPGQGFQTEDFYLWLPLIVVVLFTAVMIGLILLGRRQDRNNNTTPQQNAGVASNDVTFPPNTTHVEVVPPLTPQLTPTSQQPEQSPEMDLLSVLVVVVIFIVCVVVCGILGFQNRRRERDSRGHGGEETVTLNSGESGNDEAVRRRSHDGDAPDTPPPTYSMIERQTSYVSYISQTSSQCSIPPDYDEATQLPGADFNANRSGSRVARSVSGTRRPPPRSASGGGRSSSLRALRARFLGRRSQSAVETGQRSGARNSSHHSSVTSEQDGVDRSNVTSDLSDVFIDPPSTRSDVSQTVHEESGEDMVSMVASTASEPANLSDLRELDENSDNQHSIVTEPIRSLPNPQTGEGEGQTRVRWDTRERSSGVTEASADDIELRVHRSTSQPNANSTC